MSSPIQGARVGLLDPFGGLAGDMLLGALIDLDPELPDALEQPLSSLGLPDWRLDHQPTTRRAIGCSKATFTVPDEVDHRHLPEIRERIAGSTLPAHAKQKADRAFVCLAEAEARVHRIPIDHVHFHEVGAADAILDICAVSFGLDRLGIDELICGPLPGGSGTIRCEHGDMPCPAPAVVHLLEDFVVLAGVGEGEMVTPTGAALLRAWGRPLRAGEQLGYHSERVGYGAGTRASSIVRINLVRLQAQPDQQLSLERDEVWVLETHLDDESPELLGWLSEQLFAVGAVDVAFAPVTMKKGRPGVALTVLVPPARRTEAVATILRESTALGVREQLVARSKLRRSLELVTTPWGPVQIKWAGDRPRPEYEDLARIAREQRIPLHEVAEAVIALARKGK
ncbi:MAG TPA: nickel pincer cofactor biosynthesis protein LarC [Enhygromyxa sp.]|nr:nickel pincer cofactor biosynthesis protein LarC [Enhygromyxa sp.]